MLDQHGREILIQEYKSDLKTQVVSIDELQKEVSN